MHSYLLLLTRSAVPDPADRVLTFLVIVHFSYAWQTIMTANRDRRVRKEIQDLLKDPQSGITITSPDGSTEITNLTHFTGHFRGPPDTPYEGGQYEVDIAITDDYPFKAPRMRFITRIWHPNVSSQTGAICLDTLSTNWSPVLNLKSALISVQSLLSSPEPKDPQDAEVASMLITKPEEFERVARQWSVKYANAPRTSKSGDNATTAGSGKGQKPDDQEAKRREEQRRREAYHGYNRNMVDRFRDMGFQVEQIVDAFEFVGIDKAGGEEYEIDEEYISEITGRLLHDM